MDAPGPSPRRWMRSLLLAVGCFAAVLGAKLDYIHRGASDLPNWDQWDAEGLSVLVPWMRGELNWSDLLVPQNEHRIVPTKLFALALFEANGQWDARLECVANAVLQSLLALAIFLGGRTLLERRWHVAWLLGVFAFFGAPMSWQNLTAGFHTPQTFIVAFALATILLLATARTGRPGWWAGMACAVVSLVTMGSGLLASVAAGATLILITPLRDLLRRHGLTLAILAAIAAVGWFTRIEVDHHAVLKAQSPTAMLVSLWRSLQWPVFGFVPFPLLAWAPFAWFAWRTWRHKVAGVSPAAATLLGTGIWTLLQYAASAYARGAHGDWPAIRYLDTIALGLAVNLLALLVAVSTTRLAGWRRAARAAAAIAGLTLLAHGWWRHIDDALHVTAPLLARDNREKIERTRLYLHTGDIRHISEGVIPYPGAQSLAYRLEPPEIRAVLPSSVRAPVALLGGTDPDSPFSQGSTAPDHAAPAGWPVFGSYSATGTAATGSWRSAPIPVSQARYWRLPVSSSHPDSTGLSLRLVDESGRELATLLPTAAPSHAGWRDLIVTAPRIPTRLLANDGLAEGWLAFGAPCEMAAGSRWALALAQSGLWVFGIGGGLAVIGLGFFATWEGKVGLACRRELEIWRRTPRARLGISGALGGVVAAAAIGPLLLSRPPAYFEASVSGDLDKRSMELFFNRGNGIRGEDSVQVWFDAGETTRHLHLPITPGTIRALRIDPIDHGATLTIEQARIVDIDGAILRDLPPSTFRARSQIGSLHGSGNRLVVTSEPGALDSQLDVLLDPPVSTRPRSWHLGWRVVATIAASVFGALIGVSLTERLRRAPRRT